MKNFILSFIFLILVHSLSTYAATPGFTPPFVANEDDRLLNQGMHHYHSKTDADMKLAEKYFLQSAKIGNAKAAMMLFSIYEAGRYIPKDSKKAHQWLHKSAELGGIWSAHALGHKYETGQGVAKNLKKSYQYFKQAALGGMSEAKRDLALSFYSGSGTTKDIEQAVYWMTLAANESVSLAQYRLGMWLKNGNIGQKNLQEAQTWFAKAIKLFKVEAANGNQQAALNYAYMNDYGYGVKENNLVAFKSYHKLAQKNNASAQFWLALMYLNGDGIKKNIPKGKELLNSSYRLGSRPAKDMLKRNGWLNQNNSSSLHTVQKFTANQLELLNKFAPGINLVLIPAGNFKMGDLSGVYKKEAPVHTVKIKSFKLMAHEVTFDQYDMFVKDTGYRKPGDRGLGRGRLPVFYVSWNDATAYSKWLSKKTGLSFRLPTEAEWEYAARGGSSTRYYFGNNESDLCQYENHADAGTEYSWKNISCDDGVGAKTAFVGQYKPNPYGLYDMLGNLSEWTQDCSNKNYNGAPHDGSAWEEGNCENRVIRGDVWNGGPKSLRVSNRKIRFTARTLGHTIGFRLAMEIN